MPTQLSHLKQVLILNGKRVSGLADEDPPIEFPQIQLLEDTWGKDGTLYTVATEILGGEVTIKLLPTSPDVKRFLRWFAQIQNRRRIRFEGSYGDSELNYSTLMQGGEMKECPPTIVPGQSFEAMFVFEKLIPQYDSARFDPVAHAAA